MASSGPSFTTGLPGLDRVLHGIEAGDNVVWEIENVEDYRELVAPYAQAARAAGSRLIYFRFANPASFYQVIGNPNLPFQWFRARSADSGNFFQSVWAQLHNLFGFIS